MSSVIVGDWKRLYVAGAPRFKHKGKVILFELSDDGDVNIAQALNGEQVMCVCVCECFEYFLPFRNFLSVFMEDETGTLVRLKRGLHLLAERGNLFLSNCRLGLTMAVRCVGWMLTRTASLIYF